MNGINTTSTVASSPSELRVALFGPQVTDWTSESLASLQSSLRQDSRLEFLRRALGSLSSLWPLLQDGFGHDAFPGDKKLEALEGFAQRAEVLDPHSLTSAELSPLTVVSQTVHFIQHADLPGTDAALAGFQATQGFCIGFLSAAALAAASTWSEFEANISNAVRLAACIGIAVDSHEMRLDVPDRSETVSVRWATPEDRVYLETCLDAFDGCYVSCITDHNTLTITLPSKHQEAFSARLRDAKLPATLVGLSGSYHHRVHDKASELLGRICADNQGLLGLHDAQRLRLPLRSTADTALITTGSLAEIALKSILCKKAHWYQTIKLTIGDHGPSDVDPKVELIPLGRRGLTVPRSLRLPQKASVEASGKPHSDDFEEIAVVGMACRFPQADDVESFWKLLQRGGSAIGTMPPARFDAAQISSREPKLAKYWGNFIDEPDAFDHRFFSISGREAKSMDPQQRLALMVAYEAIESSGYYRSDPAAAAEIEKQIGCYLGVGAVEYENNVASQDANAFAAVGTLRAFISGRISHFFGWTGPSITFDTACSSSAVAIHTACKAVLSGECSMALTGGVNVITSPQLHQNLAAASFLNPDGASKAFDAGSSGYCRGEGAGMLVLKKLSSAIADGDEVLGVIASSAVNQGSNRGPITVPDSGSQSSLYRRVLSDASLDPRDVTYVEAHGTGTPVGDPIEYESVRLALASSSRDDDVFLGSVKDNIGHTEAASGAASVIKVILMMQNRMIPKQANFSTINPRIKASPRIIVPKTSRPWSLRRRVALVNNYGAAGSNAVLLIRSPSESKASSQNRREALAPETDFPIVLSAKTASSLQAYMAALHLKLSDLGTSSFASLANKIARRHNPSFEYRAAFAATGPEDALSALTTHMQSPSRTTKVPVVLCFGGQTGRHVTVSKELYNSSDLFRSHLDECDAVCRALDLGSIYPEIFKGEPINDLVSLHCMLLSVQVSSAKSWIDSGVEVDTLVGHSFGELAALCVAGSLSLTDAFRLIAGRARLIRDSWGPEHGSMVSVECARADVDDVLATVNSEGATGRVRVEIACYNGPRSFVLAGDCASVERTRAECAARGFKTVVLGNTNAYHSYLAGGILGELEAVVRSITIRPPRLRLETCSREEKTWPSVHTAEDILQHIRRPVYFSDAVERISARLGSAVWLEAGSSTPIVAMARRVVSARLENRSTDVFLPMDLRDKDATSNLSRASSQLYMAGSGPSYWLFHPSSRHRYDENISVPPYQFDKSSHWIQLKPQAQPQVVQSTKATSLVNRIPVGDAVPGGVSDGLLFWVDTSNVAFELAARGHAVTGQSLCPASMYIELAAAAAKDVFDGTVRPGKPERLLVPHVDNLVMSAPLGLNATARVLLRLREVSEDSWEFTLSSQPLDGVSVATQGRAASTEHGRGRLSWALPDDALAEKRMKVLERFAAHGRKQLSSPRTTGVSGSMVYKLFGEVVTYANYYHGVHSVSALENEAVGLVTVPAHSPSPKLHDGICDPIVLDNFLQVAGIHVNCLSPRDDDQVFMCTELQEVVFTRAFMEDRGPSRTWQVYTRYTEAHKGEMANDILVCDSETGALVLAVLGATFHGVRFNSLARNLARLQSKTAGAKQAANSPITIVTASTSTTATTTAFDSSDSEYTQGTATQTLASSTSLNDDGPGAKPSVLTNGVNGDDKSSGPGGLEAVLQGVCQLLSNIIEIPVDEIKPTSTLDQVGIDSLLVTDVLSDVQARFGVEVNQQDFMSCADMLAVAKLIESQMKPLSAAGLQTQQVQEAVPSHIVPQTNGTAPAKLEQQQFSPALEPVLNGVADSVDTGFSLAALSHDSFDAEKPTYDAHATTTGYTGFYDEVWPLQSKLVVKYVTDCLSTLGCDLQSLKPGDRVPAFPYDKKHTKLVPQLYRILVDAGLVTTGQDGVHRRTASPVPTEAASAMHQELLAGFPKHASETKLLHNTGHRLAECLTGAVDPVSLIFQNANARALLEDVYTNAPMFKTGTLLLGRYLSSVVRDIRATGRREVRILELGAGTGGTSKHIVETLMALGDTGCKISYTFTDLSPSLVAAARRKFARWGSVMEYAVMDIEKEPSPEQLARYDIVLSTNCIHATRDLVRSTTHIRKMLRPDGILCLVELTRNLYWFDLVFGLLEGWWLFDDGRDHALAHEQRWDASLRAAGFNWVDWSSSPTRESETLRVITASPHKLEGVNGAVTPPITNGNGVTNGHGHEELATKQTVTFKEADGLELRADIHFPSEVVEPGKKLPIALMIHGGGHIMLSRRDVRPAQTSLLLRNGFLPISVDYRLCPETTLLSGPMTDVADALAWVQTGLAANKNLLSVRPDVAAALDTDNVVAVGWSTGGHLAMSLGWAAASSSLRAAVKPPTAILALYAPSDYEDPFWTRPNVPEALRGAPSAPTFPLEEIWDEGIFESPITAYNVPPSKGRALGGWLAPEDARSRLALHMNVQGRTLNVLLGGPLRKGGDSSKSKAAAATSSSSTPSAEDIRAASPLAQARSGTYSSPTFLVHPRDDDLIPWQQAERTCEALRAGGVEAELRVVDGVAHLFDLGAAGAQKRRDPAHEAAMGAIWEGYRFLCGRAGLEWRG